MAVHVLQHPLAAHLLTTLRDADTPPAEFRRAAKLLSTMLILKATKDLDWMESPVRTPVAQTAGYRLADSLAVVPVLRAGLGMLEPALELFPDVAAGYIGLERHEDTALARSYYCKLPELQGRVALCLDPMLATGGSATMALSFIKNRGPKRCVMVCVVAAPEGVKQFTDAHPDVPIVTAAVDDGLDERKFIVPGLGDFGDRLFGTGG